MKIPTRECMLPEYCNFFKVVKVICSTLWTMIPIMHLSRSLRNHGSVLGAALWCKWAPPQETDSSYAPRCWNNGELCRAVLPGRRAAASRESSAALVLLQSLNKGA